MTPHQNDPAQSPARTREIPQNHYYLGAYGAWISIIGLGFILIGLLAYKAWLDGDMARFYGLLGGGAIVGLFTVGLVLLWLRGRRQRRELLVRVAHDPTSPWRWLEHWRAGEDYTDNRQDLAIFAIGLAIVSSVFAIMIGADDISSYSLRNYTLAAIALSFVGGSLIMFVYHMRFFFKYGRTHLRLANLPVPLGGELEGMIHTKARPPAGQPFTVALSCVRRDMSLGASGEKNQRDSAIWEEVFHIQPLPPNDPRYAEGAAIPLFLQVPSSLPEASPFDPRERIIWALDVSLPESFPRYKARFDLPVFDIQIQSPKPPSHLAEANAMVPQASDFTGPSRNLPHGEPRTATNTEAPRPAGGDAHLTGDGGPLRRLANRATTRQLLEEAGVSFRDDPDGAVRISCRGYRNINLMLFLGFFTPLTLAAGAALVGSDPRGYLLLPVGFLLFVYWMVIIATRADFYLRPHTLTIRYGRWPFLKTVALQVDAIETNDANDVDADVEQAGGLFTQGATGPGSGEGAVRLVAISDNLTKLAAWSLEIKRGAERFKVPLLLPKLNAVKAVIAEVSHVCGKRVVKD